VVHLLILALIAHPRLAGDANTNGVTNGLDVVYLVNYLKGFGLAPLRCGH
jgi:hypothetical protein